MADSLRLVSLTVADRHRIGADPDQDHRIRFAIFDAYQDLDPDPTSSFTHGGKSETFFKFLLTAVLVYFV